MFLALFSKFLTLSLFSVAALAKQYGVEDSDEDSASSEDDSDDESLGQPLPLYQQRESVLN